MPTRTTRILALLAIFAALAAPHLTAPTRAHADLCTACLDPDELDIALPHDGAVVLSR